MYFAAWQVQNVAGLELQVDRRRKVFDSNGFVLLALHLARRYVGALVDVPGLGSLDLQDQDVVVVVVRNESLRSGRSDVGVDLDREIQLDLDGLRQRRNGADVALKAGSCPRPPRRRGAPRGWPRVSSLSPSDTSGGHRRHGPIRLLHETVRRM